MTIMEASEATRQWAQLAQQGWSRAAQMSLGGEKSGDAAHAAPVCGAVKKGFLGAQPAPEPVADIGKFLDTEARAVMDAASELMARDAPEEMPFKFKYEAREKLVALLPRLQTCRERADLSAALRQMLEGCVGRVEHLLGVNFYGSEEVSSGEKHLMVALELLAQHHIQHMDTLNHLAMIWSTRQEYEKAKGYLTLAQQLHEGFVATAGPAGLSLSSPEQKQFTATLFLLAQVHQHTGDADNSARCCLATLDRQACSFSPAELRAQVNEWVTNAIQLSGYFLSCDHFSHSAACLAAAEAVVDTATDARTTHTECLSQDVQANLAWGWAKLHVARLTGAAEARRRADHGLQPEAGSAQPAAPDLSFSMAGATKHMPTGLEAPLDTYAGLCAVLKPSLALLETVKKAFPLDEACSEHVVVVQDISKAYKALIPYTASADDVCKLHKRRIDVLEPVALALNPQCYDWLCKELWYEIGDAYRDMLDIKVTQVDTGGKAVPKAKLMALGAGATAAYRRFVDLFKAVPGDKSVADPSKPQGLGDAATRRWYMTARFGLARCLARTPVKDDELSLRQQALGASLAEYQAIVDLMALPEFAFPKDGPNFDAELEICKVSKAMQAR